MRYDDVISLGGNCEVAQHWRRFSGDDRAFPFDWLIVPMNSVATILDDRFSNMLDPASMKVINHGRTVMCTRYGVAHHHDFPRVDGPSAQIEIEKIPAACENGRSKYAHLARRFWSSCAPGRRVLFIRSWRETLDFAPTATAPDDIIRYDFVSFIRAIERNLPGLDFRVLFVNYGPQRAEHPRALFHDIDDKNDHVDWSGSPGGWDEMFRLHAA